MPIRIGSNSCLSIAAITPDAEMHEISCSLLRPPHIMATRFFTILLSPLR